MHIYETQAQEYAQVLQEAQIKSRTDRLKQFWKTLQMVFTKFPVQKPAARPFRILDLACGICDESRVISAFFSTGIPGFPAQSAHLIGIDQDLQSIQTAVALSESNDPFHYSPLYHLALRSTFVCGDATRLELYPSIPSEIDLVLIRHQIVRRDREVFDSMVRQGLKRLSAGGMMLITSFHELEHEALLQALTAHPCETLFEGSNPHAVRLKGKYPEGDVAIDKFVCLVRRK